METRTMTKKQAARYILWRQGLIGQRRFAGKEGVMRYIRQAGCIQFDPVDVCGKNAELTLQSRVSRFSKRMLHELLYKDRLLIDHYDKNLSIAPVEDWTPLRRERDRYAQWGRSQDKVDAVREQVRGIILERGAVCSGDLPMDEVVSWYWSDTRLGRAALDAMYYAGELVIDHRKNAVKYYDLAERLLPPEVFSAPDPFESEDAYRAWRLRRRIGAVGLLRNAASDAWLNLPDSRVAARESAFARLIGENSLAQIDVEGVKDPFYCVSEALPDVDFVLTNPTLRARCEVIAPLDCFMWDRKLIKLLFDFDYTWEIYTPKEKRQYGHYTLPVLHGDSFVGRVEAICDYKSKVMTVPRFWYEHAAKRGERTRRALTDCFERLARFNDCALHIDCAI